MRSVAYLPRSCSFLRLGNRAPKAARIRSPDHPVRSIDRLDRAEAEGAPAERLGRLAVGADDRPAIQIFAAVAGLVLTAIESRTRAPAADPAYMPRGTLIFPQFSIRLPLSFSLVLSLYTSLVNQKQTIICYFAVGLRVLALDLARPHRRSPGEHRGQHPKASEKPRAHPRAAR
jgi:hypothetical protein